jgi:NADH-quinone oxidoreductase subunit C/D
MGYMHRNHEKIGERNTFLGNMPYTDRLDYISSMSNNFGYAITVEKLLNVKPPERAEYIRVIMAELTRINSHLVAIGFLLNDLGAFFTPALYGLAERELILDIFEATAGSRMMCNYFRFGGVARDLPEGVLQKIKDLVFERLPRKIEEFNTYLVNNEIVRTRCQGVGVLTAEQAIAYSTAGPILRASGVQYDVRRAEPYSIYDRFEFEIPVRYNGDIFDRFLIRMEEMVQSIRILQQAVRDIPEGPIVAGKPQYSVRVPAGEAYGRVEGPKGELGFYVISTGKINPWRYHVRAPSFINLTSLAQMSVGNKVADVVVILGSVDIVLGEVDR